MVAWKEFFENRRVDKDERIIVWLARARKEGPRRPVSRWLRKLTRPVTSRFLSRDTTVLTQHELTTGLEQVYLEVMDQAD